MSEGSGGGGEGRRGAGRMSDGIRQGIGVLTAFKDALEETLREARERGDLSPERAREVMNEALDRAQTAAEAARDRLDFAHQSQIDDLRARVEELERRLGALEDTAPDHDGTEGPGASP